ncbi:putative invertase inhibitor [Ipomoea triloba]|uniref:putative invertase inhibitor n=1 Tax=Ipomoea triloba TaxID=35885 RepID=UPI00125D3D86|nr:putative invertase inhibitor [Ipomoea triloba]
MASTFILLLLSFSIFPLFIIHGTQEDKKHYTLIQKTCEFGSHNFTTDIHYDFCTSALESRPARECQTLRGVGMASIRLVIANVTDTRRHIQAVVHSGKVRPWVKRCIDECSDLYDSALIGVEEAMTNYKSQDYTQAQYGIDQVIDMAGLCEDLFAVGSQDTPAGGCGGGVSPFSARNNNAMELSAMVLAVMRLLQEGRVH